MTVFVLNHTNGRTGAVNTLVEYIQGKRHNIYLLSHPLDHYANQDSIFSFDNKRIRSYRRTSLGVVSFISDFLISVRCIQISKFDVFIGINNFDTIPAIFCKKILRKQIKRIIYYPSDYSEDRFDNRLLNIFYSWIERVACCFSDVAVSNTKRAENARMKLGLSQNKSIVIPNPVNLSKLSFQNKQIQKDKFIYVGDVSKEHGLYEAIKFLAPIIKKLVIIGGGDDWERTIKLAQSKKIKLETYKAKDHEFVLSYLQRFNGFGLAPYNDLSKWTYFCSPLKVSEYICCGVPVLISSVPEIASVIRRQQYGVVYNYVDLKNVVQSIDNLDVNNFCEKAQKYYEKVRADKLLEPLNL